MNAIFSLPLVIFCHIYRPDPHGITMVSVPTTTVLPLTLSPFPWYYHGLCSHHHGFTVDFIPIPAVLL